jgi:hypothetical protein
MKELGKCFTEKHFPANKTLKTIYFSKIIKYLELPDYAR